MKQAKLKVSAVKLTFDDDNDLRIETGDETIIIFAKDIHVLLARLKEIVADPSDAGWKEA